MELKFFLREENSNAPKLRHWCSNELCVKAAPTDQHLEII